MALSHPPRAAACALLGLAVLGACSDDESATLTILSSAMEPTLEVDERIRVDPIDGDEVVRGDVVVLELPDEAVGDVDTFVYRVVGLPGEEIGVTGGFVTVDGEPLSEPWLPDGTTTPPFFPDSGCDPTCTIDVDELFVLGDNRVNSAASNAWGPVPVDSVTERVRFDEP